MNWFNNFSGGFNNNSNFGYHGNTTRNSFYTNSVSNTTTPSSNTIGFGNGSWGNGTGGQGNDGYIQFNSGAIGLGFNNGNTGGWGNHGGWGGNSGSWGSKFQPYDNFLINGFNPGHEQYAIVGTRNRRRYAEQAIGIIGQQGGFWGNFAYPRSLYGLS
ncbi:MAG: hypothetical protein KGO93_07780 [Cyanobacteria bacterium REEB446]|nr:hypothetical protein [Cyanobacteria bacterium REEB446]